MSRYVKTLLQMAELKSQGKNYSPFCKFGNLPGRKLKLPCNHSYDSGGYQIQCINCIYNKEDTAPKQTVEFLKNIIQTSKET